MPVNVALDPLSTEDLVRILTEPKNALVKQYKKTFELDGIDLEFDEDALHAVAEKAMERNVGARGLRSIMEKALLNIMFDLPSEENAVSCVFTKECVEGDGEPLIEYGEKPRARGKRTRKADAV